MMGLPAGWVTDVPSLSRRDQLKALGNGVCPQQAAEALRLLLPDVAAPPTSLEIGGAA
jgi:DNA (cytosine-5)-methyltransferase 1